MLKVVFLAKRKEGMSQDEFIQYWKEEHAPIAEKLPGLRKYTIGNPIDPDNADYDGTAALYFDDAESMGAAFESEPAEEMFADAGNFTNQDEELSVTVEEYVVKDDL